MDSLATSFNNIVSGFLFSDIAICVLPTEAVSGLHSENEQLSCLTAAPPWLH